MSPGVASTIRFTVTGTTLIGVVLYANSIDTNDFYRAILILAVWVPIEVLLPRILKVYCPKCYTKLKFNNRILKKFKAEANDPSGNTSFFRGYNGWQCEKCGFENIREHGDT